MPGEVARLGRQFFARPALEVAPDLLGRVVVSDSEQGRVTVRVTEVEAYTDDDDSASHAFRGRTTRNAVMFGPGGFLYLYFIYGMHWCANIVVGRPGSAAAVLLRAGEVVTGRDLAAARRPAARPGLLARGPAGLATVLGWSASATGLDLCSVLSPAWLEPGTATPPHLISRGPRVGVSSAADREWRFWLTADPSVSTYRAGARVKG